MNKDTLKCSSCGALIEFNFADGKGTCKFCGTVQKAPVSDAKSTPTVESYLQRGFLLLEDRDWQNATQFFNQVLNIEPQNYKAYMGLLFADVQIKDESGFSNLPIPIDDNRYYLNLIKFAPDKIKEKFAKYKTETLQNYLNLELSKIPLPEKPKFSVRFSHYFFSIILVIIILFFGMLFLLSLPEGDSFISLASLSIGLLCLYFFIKRTKYYRKIMSTYKYAQSNPLDYRVSVFNAKDGKYKVSE